MHIELHRRKLTSMATIGELYLDGVKECFTLEDVVREDPNPATRENEAKVYGQTAIPAGTYKVIINMSQRFGKLMPRLLDVPGFTGILIHKGNKSADTHGCILLGSAVAGDDLIVRSTEAWDSFWPKLQKAVFAGEDVDITITDDFKGAA